MHNTTTNGKPVGHFSLMRVIEDSWDRLPGSILVFLAMVVTNILVGALLAFTVSGVLSLFSSWTATFELTVPVEPGALVYLAAPGAILVYILTFPLVAAIAATGLRRARGEAVHYRQLFWQRDRWPRIMLLAALFTVVQLAFVYLPAAVVRLFLDPLAHTLSILAALFIFDRNSSVPNAVAGAARIVVANPLQILLYLAILALLSIVATWTFGLLFIVLMPFIAIATGFIYIRGSGAREI